MLRLFALAGLAMTCGAACAPAHAQNATLYTVTYVEVGPVLAKVGAGALHAYRDAARKDATSLDVFQRIDRPNQFVVLGAWADQKAFETPSDRRRRQEAERKARDHARRAERHPPAQWPVGRAAPRPARTRSSPSPTSTSSRRRRTTAPTRWSSSPTAAAGTPATCNSTSGGRPTGPNHFTVVESWANRGAFDVHEMQKETREFRMKLGPMSGALYDERLYKVLK